MTDMMTAKTGLVNQAIPQKGIGKLQGQTPAGQEEKLKKTCADFESILVYYMFKAMRQSIPKSGYLKESPGKDTYNMMLDQKIAEELANKGKGAGLQNTLFEQLNNRL
ncbi:MAG: rod-binding protein [Syntrophales bacterium]